MSPKASAPFGFPGGKKLTVSRSNPSSGPFLHYGARWLDNSTGCARTAPEQRAKILAAAEKHTTADLKTRTNKSCVTAGDLKHVALKGKGDD